MQKIRTFIFVAFASIGAIFFVLGGLFLNKKQANKLTLLLEELLSTLKELKQERLEDLMKLNAKHDALVEFIANLSYLIDEAEGKNDGTD